MLKPLRKGAQPARSLQRDQGLAWSEGTISKGPLSFLLQGRFAPQLQRRCCLCFLQSSRFPRIPRPKKDPVLWVYYKIGLLQNQASVFLQICASHFPADPRLESAVLCICFDKACSICNGAMGVVLSKGVADIGLQVS